MDFAGQLMKNLMLVFLLLAPISNASQELDNPLTLRSLDFDGECVFNIKDFFTELVDGEVVRVMVGASYSAECMSFWGGSPVFLDGFESGTAGAWR